MYLTPTLILTEEDFGPTLQAYKALTKMKSDPKIQTMHVVTRADGKQELHITPVPTNPEGEKKS